jgi:hypothetical protein
MDYEGACGPGCCQECGEAVKYNFCIGDCGFALEKTLLGVNNQ